MGSAFEQGALLLKRLLVDLALNPHADFVAQKHPVGTKFPVRQSLPESLAQAQQQFHRDISLFDPRCREVRSVNGRLEVKYQGKAGTKWITIASGAGETEGTVSVHGADGAALVGTLRGVSIEQGALVERLSAGPHEITRTIKLTDRRDWVHVETRLDPHGRVELHSLADSFRFEGQPDWSYSPSIGGFN